VPGKTLMFREFGLLLFLEMFLTGDFTMPQVQNENKAKAEAVSITIVYDNNPLLKDLQTDWGFACLVETGKTKLLFDTGDNGLILLSNMARLNINPEDIDMVFLSHSHHDHTGGLKDFLKTNRKVKVYFPQSFPPKVVEIIKKSGAEQVPVSLFKEIQTNIFTLGELMGTVNEQSMVVRSSEGLIVITGCAHPGIVNILMEVKNQFPDESIFLALGGFHLHRLTEDEINEVIQKISDMEIKNVAPTHCTGNTARKMFEDVFGADYIEAGVGKVFKTD